MTCLNTPGLIDSVAASMLAGGSFIDGTGYRGELKVILVNTDPSEPFTVERGERIAQLVVMAVEQVRLVEVDSLDPSRAATRVGPRPPARPRL